MNKKLLEYSKISIDHFSSFDQSFFNGRTESLTEYDHMINLYFELNGNDLIDICGVCRNKKELVERYLIPELILNELKEGKKKIFFILIG